MRFATSEPLPEHGFADIPFVLAPGLCRDLTAQLLEALQPDSNRLSLAFAGSSGLHAVFTRNGMGKASEEFSSLLPIIDALAAPECNAFFMNVLIIRDSIDVKPHYDCSLNPFLRRHRSPDRVSVLYLQVPDDLAGGALELYENSKLIASLTPATGKIVRFRGAYLHGVSNVTTQSARVSLVLEEYCLDAIELNFVPDFSRNAPLGRLHLDETYSTAYLKVQSLIQSLTEEEYRILRSSMNSHATELEPNNKDR